MKVVIHPHSLSGDVEAVVSKSYAHRYLIAAALSGNHLPINFGDSEDAYLTAHALNSLGFEATFNGNEVSYGAFVKKEGEQKIDVGESGSTLRFLLTLAGSLGVEAKFITRGRLAGRPMTALTKSLYGHGVLTTSNSTMGQLTPGVYTIDATVSSQFVTGLLMALPTLERDSRIVLVGRPVSSPYIEITLEVLAAAGIVIERRESEFFVKGKQKYNLTNYDMPGDFSGAAFPLVAGALGSGICVHGLDIKNPQGDKAIVDFMRRAGADISVLSKDITVRKRVLIGFRADVGSTPDLAPILAVLAAFAQGNSVLERVSRLREKESDRLFAIQDMLNHAGIKTEEVGDSLVIYGGSPKGDEFRSYSDHRMAMAAAILAAYAKGDSTIDDMACVKKSYPKFWEDFAMLGGVYEVEG